MQIQKKYWDSILLNIQTKLEKQKYAKENKDNVILEPLTLKDYYPKTIKIFLWELSLGAIKVVDSLQRLIHLSPPWCTCTICESSVEYTGHFFLHCHFASHLWQAVLRAFGWSLTFPNNVLDFLASVLVGHPFGGTKKLL